MTYVTRLSRRPPNKLLLAVLACAVVSTLGVRVTADEKSAAVLKKYPKLSREPFGRGIFAHVRRPGGRVAGDVPEIAANPHVAGTQLSYMWAELEPEQGSYCWDVLEADMHVWAEHGKKCWIEISTTDRRAVGRAARLGTPDWVFAAGVPKVQGEGTAAYPVFWDATYLQLWRSFLEAFAAKFDGDPRIEFLSTGGYSAGHEPNLVNRDTNRLISQWKRHGFDGFSAKGVYLQRAVIPMLHMYDEAFESTPIAQTIRVQSEFDERLNGVAADLGFILISNGMSVRVANSFARQQWRKRAETYRTKIGYAEWGPAGRGGGGRRGRRRPPFEIPRKLLDVYQGVIGDDAEPRLQPASKLSYVPLGNRLAEVETVQEWNEALRWAAEHLAP